MNAVNIESFSRILKQKRWNIQMFEDVRKNSDFCVENDISFPFPPVLVPIWRSSTSIIGIFTDWLNKRNMVVVRYDSETAELDEICLSQRQLAVVMACGMIDLERSISDWTEKFIRKYCEGLSSKWIFESWQKYGDFPFEFSYWPKFEGTPYQYYIDGTSFAREYNGDFANQNSGAGLSCGCENYRSPLFKNENTASTKHSTYEIFDRLALSGDRYQALMSLATKGWKTIDLEQRLTKISREKWFGKDFEQYVDFWIGAKFHHKYAY